MSLIFTIIYDPYIEYIVIILYLVLIFILGINVLWSVLTLRPPLRDPALELSTLGCSSTHNNTLQVIQTTIGSHTP